MEIPKDRQQWKAFIRKRKRRVGYKPYDTIGQDYACIKLFIETDAVLLYFSYLVILTIGNCKTDFQCVAMFV